MQRVIGMDPSHLRGGCLLEAGRLRPGGQVDMIRSGLGGFGRNLGKEDEVVVEATGNDAVVRVLSPYVARVIVANPLQVKMITHARVKTDKIDACGQRAFSSTIVLDFKILLRALVLGRQPNACRAAAGRPLANATDDWVCRSPLE
jgi:hypothetical protein